MPTISDLGQKVKAKYPGVYDDLADDVLGRKVQDKYPGAYTDFSRVTPQLKTTVANAQKEAGKSVASRFFSELPGEAARQTVGEVAQTGVNAYNLASGVTDIVGAVGSKVGAKLGGKFGEQNARQQLTQAQGQFGASRNLPIFGKTAPVGEQTGNGDVNIGKSILPAVGAAAGIVATADTGKSLFEAGKGALGSAKSIFKTNTNALGTEEKLVKDMVGKVAQGLPRDIEKFKTGISNLETKGIETYKDLVSTAKDKISTLAKIQDDLHSVDTLPRHIETFAKNIGGQAVNYVEEALAGLKEAYTSAKDASGLGRIIKLEEKSRKEGITLKEVNQLAREYGTEFKKKAFGKTGEQLTSLTSQAYENVREGIKNTVREILPPAAREASKLLDETMSSIYTVRDLSEKMATKVNTLVQRMDSPGILKKIGSLLGRGVDIASGGGIKAFLGKLGLNIEKTTLNAVELEKQLPKLIEKIDSSLSKTGDEFIQSIVDTAKESARFKPAGFLEGPKPIPDPPSPTIPLGPESNDAALNRLKGSGKFSTPPAQNKNPRFKKPLPKPYPYGNF